MCPLSLFWSCPPHASPGFFHLSLYFPLSPSHFKSTDTGGFILAECSGNEYLPCCCDRRASEKTNSCSLVKLSFTSQAFCWCLCPLWLSDLHTKKGSLLSTALLQPVVWSAASKMWNLWNYWIHFNNRGEWQATVPWRLQTTSTASNIHCCGQGVDRPTVGRPAVSDVSFVGDKSWCVDIQVSSSDTSAAQMIY